MELVRILSLNDRLCPLALACGPLQGERQTELAPRPENLFATLRIIFRALIYLCIFFSWEIGITWEISLLFLLQVALEMQRDCSHHFSISQHQKNAQMSRCFGWGFGGLEIHEIKTLGSIYQYYFQNMHRVLCFKISQLAHHYYDLFSLVTLIC